MTAGQREEDRGEPPVDPLLGQPRMVDDPRISIAQAATLLGKTIRQVRHLITRGRLPRHGPPHNLRPLLLSEVEAVRDMTDDPRITTAQAAELLGKTARQVHRLVATGRLPRHGPPHNLRPLLLSEVQALHAKGEPITLQTAASTLKRSIAATQELVDAGELPIVPGTKTMVYPTDVDAIIKQAEQPKIRQPKGPPGHLSTKQTAHYLGLTGPYVVELAEAEKLKGVFQDGGWWFDPVHVEMVRRARQARRKRTVHRRPMRPSDRPSTIE